MDLPTHLGPLRPIPQRGIKRMRPAVQIDVGAEESARADGNQARVEDDAVGVYVDAFA